MTRLIKLVTGVTSLRVMLKRFSRYNRPMVVVKPQLVVVKPQWNLLSVKRLKRHRFAS